MDNKEWVEIVKRLDQKIIDLEKRIDEKDKHNRELVNHVEEKLTLTQANADKAITKSDKATESHFTSVNNFNERMKEVTNQQASREWAEQFAKSTDERFKMLERRSDEREGTRKNITYALGVAVAAIGIIMFLINLKLK